MIRKYFEFVRFSNTVFALPFALASMAVAAGGLPGWRTVLLILAAMVCVWTGVQFEVLGTRVIILFR